MQVVVRRGGEVREGEGRGEMGWGSSQGGQKMHWGGSSQWGGEWGA